MPGEAPTFSTLTDIANMANQFVNDCNTTTQFAVDRLARVNRYIKIQDPAFPDDPTKRIWHPNMTAFYTPEQLAVVQIFYDEIVRQHDFWMGWCGTDCKQPPMEIFNVVPKLDQLVAAGLGHMISG